MIELGVIKLTDLLFGLIKYKHSNVLNLLDEIYNAFESVHKDYMESFRNYLELISTSKKQSGRAHPVLHAIKQDQLFLADARLKLIGLIQVHEDSRIFSELLRKMSHYLYGIEGIELRRMNQIRIGLLKEIERIPHRNLASTRYEVNRLRSDVKRIARLHPDHPLRALAQSHLAINDDHVNDIIKFEMALVFDFVIEKIQKRYADVVREYYSVKQRLT